MINNMSDLPTISELIQQYQDRTGASYRDMAKLTGLSPAKIGQMALADKALHVQDLTQQKLARGLRIPLATVRRAVAASMNYPTGDVPRTGLIQEIIDQLDEFSETEIVMVAEVVAAIFRNRVLEPDPELDPDLEPEPSE